MCGTNDSNAYAKVSRIRFMKKTVLVLTALARVGLTAQSRPSSPAGTLTREPHALREEKHLFDRLTCILARHNTYLRPAAASGPPRP